MMMLMMMMMMMMMTMNTDLRHMTTEYFSRFDTMHLLSSSLSLLLLLLLSS